MNGQKPPKGSVRNPLLGMPRNRPCYCGADKKFKHCCLPELRARAYYVKREMALTIQHLMIEAKQNENPCLKNNLGSYGDNTDDTSGVQ